MTFLVTSLSTVWKEDDKVCTSWTNADKGFATLLSKHPGVILRLLKSENNEIRMTLVRNVWESNPKLLRCNPRQNIPLGLIDGQLKRRQIIYYLLSGANHHIYIKQHECHLVFCVFYAPFDNEIWLITFQWKLFNVYSQYCNTSFFQKMCLYHTIAYNELI